MKKTDPDGSVFLLIQIVTGASALAMTPLIADYSSFAQP